MPMPSIFAKIIAGDLPGTFVWSDDDVVAFLSIAPLVPGHTLVVPRQEIDQWTDLPAHLLAHCFDVAQTIGRAVVKAFDAPRAGVVVAGFEVPHTHIHVFPAWSMTDFDFAGAHQVSGADVAAPAKRIRKVLRELGYGADVAE